MSRLWEIVSPLWEITAKIGLSALLAGLIGAEREWTGKWAGLRTHMLIGVGAALLTHVSILIGLEFAEGRSNAWDPGRIAAQIVSGVGFIGAGTIIQSRGAVHGLTTAAGLWVASGLGIAVGSGFFAEAVLTTVALLVILIALRPLEQRLLRGDRRTVMLQLGPGQKLSRLMDFLETARVQPEKVTMSRSGEGISALVQFRGSPEDSQRLVQMASREDLLASEEENGDREERRGPFP
ncbi:MAG TPA: MgtC/SapB family protein [Thermoanaerobaculia bacterium]|nr:MgtC/SapB family protein [Thermoanaerobaculia bacterium]